MSVVAAASWRAAAASVATPASAEPVSATVALACVLPAGVTECLYLALEGRQTLVLFVGRFAELA